MFRSLIVIFAVLVTLIFTLASREVAAAQQVIQDARPGDTTDPPRASLISKIVGIECAGEWRNLRGRGKGYLKITEIAGNEVKGIMTSYGGQRRYAAGYPFTAKLVEGDPNSFTFSVPPQDVFRFTAESPRLIRGTASTTIVSEWSLDCPPAEAR